ncbi:hypothetical protein BH11PSE12_BH11PSE12_14290 [soil metagenome]
MKRRKFLTGGMVLASYLMGMPDVLAQVSGVADAINKAGRQRMLSQRLAKCYLQIGMDIDTEHSKKTLDLSLALFERQLAELRNFAPSADIKSAMLDMDASWLQYKQLLAGKTPNKRDGKSLIALSEDVLFMADKITVQLEKYAGTASGQLVNLSGRQRMLSQRMAKYYQAAQWDIAPVDGSSKLAATRKEFIAGLAALNNAPGNTVKMKEELAMAQQQWVFFDNAIALPQTQDPKARRIAATNVATTSERLLEIMDKVTAMYQQMA